MRRATFAVKNDFSEASPSGAHNGLLSRVKRSLVPPRDVPRGAWYSGYSLPFGLLYTKFTWMHIVIHSSNYFIKNTSKCTKRVYHCLDRSNLKLWELSIPTPREMKQFYLQKVGSENWQTSILKTSKAQRTKQLLLCRRWKPLPTDWNAHFKTLMCLL